MSGAAQRTEVIDVDIENLYKAITDYKNYTEFVSGMKQVDVIEKKENEALVEFSLDMLKPIQYVIRIHENFDKEQGRAEVKWTLESSDFLKLNNGGWLLKSLGDGKTEATYTLDIDFAIPVPGFVRKGLVKNNLPKAMNEFGERAKGIA